MAIGTVWGIRLLIKIGLTMPTGKVNIRFGGMTGRTVYLPCRFAWTCQMNRNIRVTFYTGDVFVSRNRRSPTSTFKEMILPLTVLCVSDLSWHFRQVLSEMVDIRFFNSTLCGGWHEVQSGIAPGFFSQSSLLITFV